MASPSGRRRRRRMILPLSVALAGCLLLVGGWHWASLGWRDKHIGYPSRPSGYSAIVATFGQPCNAQADDNWADWRAADNGVYYHFHFHKKLGGVATEMVTGKGGTSTNLDNDVYGHIRNQHLDGDLRSGIWGYNCRYIAGTTKWSTHAWGIAVDVSAAWEHFPGHYHSHVNYTHALIWENHRWYWGKNFGDAMHFQYANNY